MRQHSRAAPNTPGPTVVPTSQELPAPVRAALPQRLLWLADDPWGRQVVAAGATGAVLNGILFWLWARQRRKLGIAQPLYKGSEWKL